LADVYFDSTALTKRYVQETGTAVMDTLFDMAAEGRAVIATSLWNIGEALGVLDYKRQRHLVTEEEFHLTLRKLASEVTGLIRTGAMQVYPVRASLLAEAWTIVLAEHLYEADALQIVTCRDSNSRALITSDRHLRNATLSLGLKALNPENQRDEIEDLFNDR